ncbi:MAG: MFS transporter [Gammaproteobacteria bacterium]|nr:MFS transporter [Gammaproteobacteria bacterium]
MLSVFYGHRDFRRLAFGSAFHSASWQGEQVVVGLLVFQLTGSTAWVGIAYALAFAPMLIVGVPAGATADRFDRRRLQPLFEALLVIVMGAMALLFAAGIALLPVVLAATFATGSLRAMQHPVRLSYAHDILGPGKLLGALSRLSVLTRLGQLLGALLIGVVMEHTGNAAAYAGLAMLHVMACFILLQLREGGQPREATAQTLRDNLREYLHELYRNPTLLRLTLLASLVEIFGFSFTTALPEIASVRLDTGADGLGLIHSARAAGGLLAGVVLARVGTLRSNARAYAGSIMGFGVALLVLAASPTLLLAMLAAGLIATMAATCDILAQTMMQLSVADRLRGRAMGAWVLSLGAGPIGHVEVGLLAGVVGGGVMLTVNGICLLAIAAGVFASVGAFKRSQR